MINSVIFDMDGVIFDTERVFRMAWVMAADEMGIPGIQSVLTECTGRNHHDTQIIWDNIYHGKYDLKEFWSVRKRYFDMITKDELPVKPGVYEIMDYLHGNNYGVALATSTELETTMANLERTGLRNAFDVIITGNMVTNGKPAPDIYLMAAAGLKDKGFRADTNDCIGIEDSVNGIHAIKNAGMKPVMVPDLIIPDSKLKSVLFAECESLLSVIRLIEKENK